MHLTNRAPLASRPRLLRRQAQRVKAGAAFVGALLVGLGTWQSGWTPTTAPAPTRTLQAALWTPQTPDTNRERLSTAKATDAASVTLASVAVPATAPAEAVAETSSEAGRHFQTGVASYYGREFSGRRTANGERFDPNAFTAAHRTLPFGTRLRVTNPANSKSIVVRVNDRGPFHGRRILDLSMRAAAALGLIHRGSGSVEIAVLGRGPRPRAEEQRQAEATAPVRDVPPTPAVEPILPPAPRPAEPAAEPVVPPMPAAPPATPTPLEAPAPDSTR